MTQEALKKMLEAQLNDVYKDEFDMGSEYKMGYATALICVYSQIAGRPANMVYNTNTGRFELVIEKRG